MQRYHKKISFPHEAELKSFTEKLNISSWKYTTHCLENIQYREIDLEHLLTFVKNLSLNHEDIFEYYYLNGIHKACFRVKYTDTMDVILVLNSQKMIVTIYFNSITDEHETLNATLYSK